MQKLTKDIILKFLSKNRLMAVATYGKDHPWIAYVYYSFDNDLNLYFLSSPSTLHCKQISLNPKVAISIADSRQKLNEFKKGLQIYGIAEEVKGVVKIKHALKSWKQALDLKDPELSYENMLKKVISGRMFKIKPKKIKFFNQELFKVDDGLEPFLEL